jgi:hypothetical protein
MAETPITKMQAIKAEQDAKIAAHETAMAALEQSEGKEARKYFFFNNKDKDAVETVNLLSSRVDAIRDPAKRKAFFMAHPELEVRYSFINFVE